LEYHCCVYQEREGQGLLKVVKGWPEIFLPPFFSGIHTSKLKASKPHFYPVGDHLMHCSFHPQLVVAAGMPSPLLLVSQAADGMVQVVRAHVVWEVLQSNPNI
jgi:hypothetical protein